MIRHERRMVRNLETEQRKLMAMLCALEHRFHVKGGVLKLIPEARDLVGRILEDDPERLTHCAGVAARAQALVATVPQSAADTLVASAWVHDIGYGSRLRDSGFHPLDGAVVPAPGRLARSRLRPCRASFG